MARAAISGRLTWRVATLIEARDETATARTLALAVPGWPGHLPGQHVDLRLTAEDGYKAERSYSLAHTVQGDRIELTVQRLIDGEVSPYLTDTFKVGDPIEVRGPVGGWFVWRATDTAPVLLIAGGSGVVPLMAMVRARGAIASRVPFRLLYSVRTPDDVIYSEELVRRVRDDHGLDVFHLYTRSAPPAETRGTGRMSAADLAAWGWPPEFEPTCFVCGPTKFVEAAADLLVNAGHDPKRIKTERFGG
jgi:ferredoxin-NADP reductase